jgi:hypothetical protein
MAYKILHLPTGTYMWYSLQDGKINTRNLYTQYEIDNKIYDFINKEEKPSMLFKNRGVARRFLDRWVKLSKEENNGCIDELIFDESEPYIFKRHHFSILEVADEV